MAHSNPTTTKSLRKANYFLALLLGVNSLVLVFALSGLNQKLSAAFYSYNWFAQECFVLATFYGVIFIYLSSYNWHQRVDRLFLLGAYLSIPCLWLSQYLGLTQLPYFNLLATAIFWATCLSSLLIACCRTTGNERLKLINLCLTLLTPILFVFLSGFFLAYTAVLAPRTHDLLLLAVDHTLGIDPSFLAGQLFLRLPDVFLVMIKLIYLGLPFCIAITYVGRYHAEGKLPTELIIEFLLIGVIGTILYHFVPGCGPLYAFKMSWPYQLPTILLKPTPEALTCALSPRNCFPSLHTAWAACLWRHSKRCHRGVQWVVLLWIIVMLSATLGFGEHYLIDLIVGFAFSLISGGLCAVTLSTQHKNRRRAILGGCLICLGWYWLIFSGLAYLQLSPWVAWGCYLSSLWLTGYLEFKLMQAQRFSLATVRT